jgi:hypothetical protein
MLFLEHHHLQLFGPDVEVEKISTSYIYRLQQVENI